MAWKKWLVPDAAHLRVGVTLGSRGSSPQLDGKDCLRVIGLSAPSPIWVTVGVPGSHNTTRLLDSKELLTRADRTSFYLTRPEAPPTAVIARFMRSFEDYGIRVGSAVEDILIHRASASENSQESVHNRLPTQAEHTDTIRKTFNGVARGIATLGETQVPGPRMRKGVADPVSA